MSGAHKGFDCSSDPSTLPFNGDEEEERDDILPISSPPHDIPAPVLLVPRIVVSHLSRISIIY